VRLSRLSSIGFLVLVAEVGSSAENWSGTGLPLLNSDAELQRTIDSLPPDGTLDCQGGHYTVTALLLHSRMTMQNCWLHAAPGSTDLVSPITIDGRSTPKTGIAIRNVHVDGNRHAQSNIDYAGEENGGRHCFRLLGVVSDVLIEDSSGNFCASDGLALVSYGVSASDQPDRLPFQRITVRNTDFSYNRRHGASVDGVHTLTFDNVTFSFNGVTVSGGAEGDQCVMSGEQCFGTGFWYEDYRPEVAGEGLNDVTFVRCVFRMNYQRSLFFISRGRQLSPEFQPRSNIRILNSYLDSGQLPLAEDYAVQFQVDEPLVGLGAVFRGVTIENTALNGSLGMRQLEQLTVSASQIRTRLPYLGYSAYSNDLTFRATSPDNKSIAASLTPNGGSGVSVTYFEAQLTVEGNNTTTPVSGIHNKGDTVWNTGASLNLSGWICLVGGNPCARWQSF
jgi:hypothetical protein